MISDNKKNEVWNKAANCNCGENDCKQNHKLCSICGEKMIYGAYESMQPNSEYSWNIDHIRPISNGGTNDTDNLQAVRVKCNRNKGNL